MLEKIISIGGPLPSEYAGRKIVPLSEGQVRCKYLPQIRSLIGGGGIIAMPQEQLGEGTRGLAKAQILTSLYGVETILACENQVITDLGGQIISTSKQPALGKNLDSQAIRIKEALLPEDKKFMDYCKGLLDQSTCWWRATSCEIVVNGEITVSVSSQNSWCTGCKDLQISPSQIKLNFGERIEFCNGTHAEIICLGEAARNGNSLKDSTLYITTGPCEECSKALLNSGISRVVFDGEYYDREGVRLLQSRGIMVEKLLS